MLLIKIDSIFTEINKMQNDLSDRNIKVVKVGMAYLQTLNGDKNSAIHEYNIILKAVYDVATQEWISNMLIVLGGRPNEKEAQDILEELNNTVYQKKIFIATDFECFYSCREIISKCDIVLHQGKLAIPDISGKEQCYSYVPELFYAPIENKPVYQHNLCLFGGNNIGREDKFETYLFADKETIAYKFMVLGKLYKENGKDFDCDVRLNYEEYLKFSRLFKFSLMVCRREYRSCGWITSRYIEAPANYNLPIVDVDFDITQQYSKGLPIVSSYNDFLFYTNKYQADEARRIEAIMGMRRRIERNKDMFKEVLVDAYSGRNFSRSL
jgi:hypothetical protein